MTASWASTLFPYALLLTTGAYVTGAIALLARGWIAPTRLAWWAVLLALGAFGVDRLMPQYAVEAAPVACIFAIVLAAQIVATPGILGLRNLLWSVFALVPIAFVVDIASADFFPAVDADAMRAVAAGLLVIPGIAAIVGAIGRAISPARGT